MKKALVTVLCLAILFTNLIVYASNQTRYFYDGKWHNYTALPITLQVLGQEVKGEMPPILFNNSTVVPAREVFEKLGAKVGWNGEKKQAEVSMGSTNILLTINSKDAVVNGITHEMPIPAKIINNKTMIPVRFVAETIGMKVQWIDAERLIKIDRNDVNVDDVRASVNDSTVRVTINSDYPIAEYETLEFNNHPRLAVDIKNAVLTTANREFEVKSTFVYKVRFAQNNDKPNIVRVVADLMEWTSYSVSLSEDRKQIYIDFVDAPSDINAVRFSKNGSQDVIDVDMKYARKPLVSSSGSKVSVEIPMSQLKGVESNISAAGSFIRSIECRQKDSNTAVLTMEYSGIAFFEAAAKEGGLRLCFSPQDTNKFLYKGESSLQIVIKSERIGFNYFNYNYRNEGNNYIFSAPAGTMNLNLGRLLVNDRSVNYIDIVRNSTGSRTEVLVNTRVPYDFKVNTVADNNQILLAASSMPDSSRNSDLNRGINPKIREKIVVIDPGHGGNDNGATYPFTYKSESEVQVKEKDLNLDISRKLFDMLRNAGIQVLMTRQDDSRVELYDRGDFANKNNASLLVSVHNNSGNSWDSGTMTLYYPTINDASYGMSGERASQIIHEEMLKALGTIDRGIWKRPKLAVLNNARMPSVLAEVAYISNESDRQRLMTDSFRTRAAESLYNGIIRTLTEMVESEGSDSRNTAPANKGFEDMDLTNINGFIIPPKYLRKCSYKGSVSGNSSLFDLSIQLDYAKELAGTAALEEQRNEAKQVLASKLDEDTVQKIMNALAWFRDYDTFIWEDELEGSGYRILVRNIRNSGLCTIELMKK